MPETDGPTVAVTGLDALLNDRGWLLTDGATGTNLFALGLEAGDAPELLNRRNPEMVKTVYRDSIAGGADLILTNSLGGNRARLKLHGAEDHSRDLSRISAELAQETAAELGHGTIIAGSIGPTGELMEPMGSLSSEAATEIFLEQAEGLKAGGANIAWIETISDLKELDSAARACVEAGLPYCATMSFDTAGRTMMGVAASDLADWAAQQQRRPLAFGANCGVGASDLIRTMLEFPKPEFGTHLIAKANAGIPKWVEGAVHYDGSPELMADYAELALRSGARIIGGCCGTTCNHLRSMRRRLENFSGGEVPLPDEIIQRLGQHSPPAGTAARGRNRRRPRRPTS